MAKLKPKKAPAKKAAPKPYVKPVDVQRAREAKNELARKRREAGIGAAAAVATAAAGAKVIKDAKGEPTRPGAASGKIQRGTLSDTAPKKSRDPFSMPRK